MALQFSSASDIRAAIGPVASSSIAPSPQTCRMSLPEIITAHKDSSLTC